MRRLDSITDLRFDEGEVPVYCDWCGCSMRAAAAKDEAVGVVICGFCWEARPEAKK